MSKRITKLIIGGILSLALILAISVAVAVLCTTTDTCSQSQVSDKCKEKWTVALTFDDGPHHENTPQLLNILKQENITATFYLKGNRVQEPIPHLLKCLPPAPVCNWLQADPGIVKRMLANGHMLAAHGMDHIHMDQAKTVNEVGWEIFAGLQAIHNLTRKQFLAAVMERADRGEEIHMEKLSKQLGVEKRRVYDLVNVMEALCAMSKGNKCFYLWHGFGKMPALAAQLQAEAKSLGMPQLVQMVERNMCSGTTENTRASSSPWPDEDSNSAFSPPPHSVCDESSSLAGGCDDSGKNSLIQLCRRFLMIMLSKPSGKQQVSLDVASTILIKDVHTEGFTPPSRSRCRRLYDVANVLVSLGIVSKQHYMFGTKKIPLFIYAGPQPLNGGPVEAMSSGFSHQSAADFSSLRRPLRPHDSGLGDELMLSPDASPALAQMRYIAANTALTSARPSSSSQPKHNIDSILRRGTAFGPVGCNDENAVAPLDLSQKSSRGRNRVPLRQIGNVPNVVGGTNWILMPSPLAGQQSSYCSVPNPSWSMPVDTPSGPPRAKMARFR